MHVPCAAWNIWHESHNFDGETNKDSQLLIGVEKLLNIIWITVGGEEKNISLWKKHTELKT